MDSCYYQAWGERTCKAAFSHCICCCDVTQYAESDRRVMMPTGMGVLAWKQVCLHGVVSVCGGGCDGGLSEENVSVRSLAETALA